MSQPTQHKGLSRHLQEPEVMTVQTP